MDCKASWDQEKKDAAAEKVSDNYSRMRYSNTASLHLTASSW